MSRSSAREWLNFFTAIGGFVLTVVLARWLAQGDGNLAVAIWIIEIGLLGVIGYRSTSGQRRTSDAD